MMRASLVYFPALVAACFVLAYAKLPRFPCEISWTAAVDERAHYLLVVGALFSPLVLRYDGFPFLVQASGLPFILLAVAKQDPDPTTQFWHDVGVNGVLVMNGLALLMGDWPMGLVRAGFLAAYVTMRPICKVGSLYFLSRDISWFSDGAVQQFLEKIAAFRARGDAPMDDFVNEKVMMWLSGLHQWSIFLLLGYFLCAGTIPVLDAGRADD